MEAASGMENLRSSSAMPPTSRQSRSPSCLRFPQLSVELFRYRGAAKDGGTLGYVFEAGEQNSQRRNQTLRCPSETTTVSKRSRHSPFGFESSFFSSALGFSTSALGCSALGCSTSPLLTGRSPSLRSPLPGRGSRPHSKQPFEPPMETSISGECFALRSVEKRRSPRGERKSKSIV